MITPDKKLINWSVLVVITLIGAGISLYGYFKISDISSAAYLPVTRPYPKIIFIDEPKANKAIESPVEISGRAKTSEGVLTIIIKDANEGVLQKTTINNMKGDIPLAFSATLPFSKPTSKTGKIEAMETMPDGSQTGQTAIPVLFAN